MKQSTGARRGPAKGGLPAGALARCPRPPAPHPSPSRLSHFPERREDTRTEGGASACCGGADVDAACAPGARALPLVCKRWRHVFHTSAVLHGTLSLDLKQLEARISSPEDEAALRRVLQLRGQAARRLWLHSGGRRLSMPDVLALLAPQLQAVRQAAGVARGRGHCGGTCVAPCMQLCLAAVAGCPAPVPMSRPPLSRSPSAGLPGQRCCRRQPGAPAPLLRPALPGPAGVHLCRRGRAGPLCPAGGADAAGGRVRAAAAVRAWGCGPGIRGRGAPAAFVLAAGFGSAGIC